MTKDQFITLGIYENHSVTALEWAFDLLKTQHQEEVAPLLEALEFYAEPHHWSLDGKLDLGMRANEALQAIESLGEKTE